MKAMNVSEWLEIGYANGWCGPPLCATHDGIPSTDSEDTEFNEGYDPCIPILRLYEERETKLAVEAAHSPSTWRASNLGL